MTSLNLYPWDAGGNSDRIYRNKKVGLDRLILNVIKENMEQQKVNKFINFIKEKLR